MNNEELIVLMLINKQPYFKELVKPLIIAKDYMLKNKNFAFKDDIEKDFKEKVMSHIADDICKNLAIPYEEVAIVLENVNINNYLSI